MSSNNLHSFIQLLASKGELVRIQEPVSPHLQITEIADRISKTPEQNKALLFENNGTDFPLLINALGSERRICLALGVEKLDDIAHRIEQLFQDLQKPRARLWDKLALLPTLSSIAQFFPQIIKGRGACQEVILPAASLDKFPILTCWPKDGGAFITLPIVHTLDPETRIRNIGMYRMQVFSPEKTAMHWHQHKVSARHFRAYKARKEKMPVAVALGGDPVYTYAATAPLPDNVDEYILAGFLRKKPVRLVACLTQPDIMVPEDADIIIEGYVDPEAPFLWEGPFGDHTGFYSLPDWYPAFNITAITHKKNAIYPTTIVGIPPQEDAWIGKATERIFLSPLKRSLIPELTDMLMPIEGVFHNLVMVKIKQDYAGQAFKVMNALWGAGQMMFNKMLMVFDEDADWTNMEQLARDKLTHFDPLRDTLISRGPMDVLDHSCSAMGFGGKICFDFTHKSENETTPPTSSFYFTENPSEVHPSLSYITTKWIKKGIPLLFVFLNKTKPQIVSEIRTKMETILQKCPIKIVVFFDHFMPQNNDALLFWIAFNNIDPERDTYISPKGKWISFDATIKTLALDGFQRDWPNPIASDPATIASVNEMWHRLGLGKSIVSPSLDIHAFTQGSQAKV